MRRFKSKLLGDSDQTHKKYLCKNTNSTRVQGHFVSIFVFVFFMEMERIEIYERIIEQLVTEHYAVIDDFFSIEHIRQFRMQAENLAQADALKKAAIGQSADKMIAEGIRGDFIHWMDEKNPRKTEAAFFEKVQNFMEYLNRTCYLGLDSFEFHYAYYPPGTWYKRHFDTFHHDDRRRFSMICYLQTAAWKPENGGALHIYIPTEMGEKTIEVAPQPGRVVIFDSRKLAHEVCEVVKDRWSITGWLKTR